MRVAHLSFSDLVGGAARGSYALHQALVDQGVDSWLLVEGKTVDDPRVLGEDGRVARWFRRSRHRVDRVVLRPYRNRDHTIFSTNFAPSSIVSRVRALDADIVHLHWVAASFVIPELLPRFGVPVVWTIRDMWPFTGGCHVAYDCRRYRQSCGSCPHLRSTRERDLSRLVWYRKKRAWKNADLYPVGVSEWIAQEARSSSLFGDKQVRVIENAVDTEYWQGVPQADARQRFGLPADKHVLLFISWFLDDHYKGFDLFRSACRRLAETDRDRYHALVVGTEPSDGDRDLGIGSTYTGHLSDDSAIRQAYGAADVTVLPSRADAFGKAAAESLSCGTPCVVFDGTGLGDVVDHEITGWVAPQGDVDGLARGIRWTVEDEHRWRALGASGRVEAVRRFSVGTQASEYVNLYGSILSGRTSE